MDAGYQQFLTSKLLSFTPCGFEPDSINPALFPFQQAIVRWAVRRGKGAIFADTGLGKTPMQLEWAAQVQRHTGKRILIVAPLCVSQQTVEEGKKFGIELTYVKTPQDLPITITNYERLDAFDLNSYEGIVLDESSILKHHDSKTRKKIIDACQRTPYRLSCTATPSPNDFMELGNQSEFLGIMSMQEMLAMFFIHDGGETQKWRLKGHGKQKFWEWLSTWAICMRRPSDLGFSDEGFILPALDIRHHKLKTTCILEGNLFPMEAQTLSERLDARRKTIDIRVDQVRRMTGEGTWIVWCHYNEESQKLAAAIEGAVEIIGSESIEAKERKIMAFTRGEIRCLVTKPSIAGFGLNWQHCHQVAFVGLNDSYEEFYQAIRRCYRFGQTLPVNVEVVTTDVEGSTLSNIERKEAQAEEMMDSLVDHMKTLTKAEIMKTSKETAIYAEDSQTGDGWQLRLGDCVEQLTKMESDSVHYSVFSPPFASLYTYSNSERDMGNAKNHAEFYEHFRFMVKELFRVLKPGRNVSFHCMNLPTSKQNDGMIGIRDFRGELIRMFCAEGFIYHSEVCIWKDPVTAMQRTKALGLLWKQLKKDSVMSRMGIPDYVVTMRKPGENKEPVAHEPEEFPVSRWQKWASPIWMDIDPSNTLNRSGAREEEDERHIAPLQLDVIERCICLWSNPGDLVLSPFAGIGSEGVISLKTGRRFIGVELKRSYFNLAVRHLQEAQREGGDLFSKVVDIQRE